MRCQLYLLIYSTALVFHPDSVFCRVLLTSQYVNKRFIKPRKTNGVGILGCLLVLRAMRSWPVESRRWVRKVANLVGVWKREYVCFETEEELTAWKRHCVEGKRCWRGWCRNLLRERPDIGEKTVPKTRRSVSERAIGEFELGCEWRKRETEVHLMVAFCQWVWYR